MQVRQAGPQDVLAIETVRVSTWKVAYRGLLPDAFLDGVEPDVERRAARMARCSSWLALDGDAPVGMAVTGPCRDEDRPDVPELYALYVLPSAWGTGVGTALMQAAGPVRLLWVLEGNIRARRFYAQHGFAPDGATKTVQLGAPVVEVRMTRP